MKKLLSLGLILGVCGSFMVGCTKKLSDEEMIECKKYEDKLADDLYMLNYLVEEMVENSNNVNGYKPILGNKKLIHGYEEKINNISLEKLELYHKNLKEYKKIEDNNFQDVKYKYLLGQRKLAYCKEIISLCEDKNISLEDQLKIQNLGVLSTIIANKNDEDSFAHSEKLINLQTQMDEKYKLDSNELYLLQEVINK